jgi:hypothetical protein
MKEIIAPLTIVESYCPSLFGGSKLNFDSKEWVKLEGNLANYHLTIQRL